VEAYRSFRNSHPADQLTGNAPRGSIISSEVDNPMVVPVGKNARAPTSNDVIHAGMVPGVRGEADRFPASCAIWFSGKEGILRASARSGQRTHGSCRSWSRSLGRKVHCWVGEQKEDRSGQTIPNKKWNLADLKAPGEGLRGELRHLPSGRTGRGSGTFPALDGSSSSMVPGSHSRSC